jgi:hypothetical protein
MASYNAHSFKLMLEQFTNIEMHKIVQDILVRLNGDTKLPSNFNLVPQEDVSNHPTKQAYLTITDVIDQSTPIAAIIDTTDKITNVDMDLLTVSTMKLKPTLSGIRVIHIRTNHVFGKYAGGIAMELVPDNNMSVNKWISTLGDTPTDMLAFISICAQIHAMHIALSKEGLHPGKDGYKNISIISVGNDTQMSTTHGIINTFGNLAFLGNMYKFKTQTPPLHVHDLLYGLFDKVAKHNPSLYSLLSDIHQAILPTTDPHYPLDDFNSAYMDMAPEIFSLKLQRQLSCGHICKSKESILEAITNPGSNYYDQLIVKINNFIEVYQSLQTGCLTPDVVAVSKRLFKYLEYLISSEIELISRAAEIEMESNPLTTGANLKPPSNEEIKALILKYSSNLPALPASGHYMSENEILEPGTIFTVKVNAIDELLAQQGGYLIFGDSDQILISRCVPIDYDTETDDDHDRVTPEWFSSDFGSKKVEITVRGVSHYIHVSLTLGETISELYSVEKFGIIDNAVTSLETEVYDINTISQMIGQSPYKFVENYVNVNSGINVTSDGTIATYTHVIQRGNVAGETLETMTVDNDRVVVYSGCTERSQYLMNLELLHKMKGIF